VTFTMRARVCSGVRSIVSLAGWPAGQAAAQAGSVSPRRPRQATGKCAAGPPPRPEDPAPAAVLEQLRQGLRGPAGSAAEAGEAVRLAEAVRVLAARHGPAAVRHCVRLVEGVRDLLDEATGAGAVSTVVPWGQPAQLVIRREAGTRASVRDLQICQAESRAGR